MRLLFLFFMVFLLGCGERQAAYDAQNRNAVLVSEVEGVKLWKVWEPQVDWVQNAKWIYFTTPIDTVRK